MARRLWDRYGFSLLLVVAVFIVYHRTFPYAFLYDDEFLIQKNRFLDSFESWVDIFGGSSTAGAGFKDSFYRPVQGLLYLVVQQLFGKEPWAFHFLNISLHAINAVLIFLLGTRMRLSKTAAFLAALIWALHPIHNEAVAYMSATADPSHTLFVLLGLICVVPDFRWPRILLSCVFFSLALISKESAIVFPGLLVAMIFFFDGRRWSLKPYLRTLPAWGVAFAYLFIRQNYLNLETDFRLYKQTNIYTENMIYRVYTYLAAIPSYLELLVWPHDLHMDRVFSVFTEPFFLPVVLGIAIVAVSILLILRTWRRKSTASIWVAWCLLWFFGSQVPQMGILIPSNSLFLEHWMYLPSIALVLGLGALFHALEKKGRPSVAILSAIFLVPAVALGVATHVQNQYWENPIVFFGRILKYNPNADRVRHNLAMAYSDLGEDEFALQNYLIVLSHTQEYPQTFHNVARIYVKRGQLDLAEQYENKAIQINPRFYPSYGTLSEIWRLRGDLGKAAELEKKFWDYQK